MKYRQPLDLLEDIFSSSVGRPRPTVVYIIVIYRQPCVLHISWYTVHYPSGGVHCAWSGGTIVFMG